MVSKSNLAKVKHEQLCSPLVAVIFADKFVYLFKSTALIGSEPVNTDACNQNRCLLHKPY